MGKKVVVLVANATPPSNPTYTLKALSEHWITVQDGDGTLVFFQRPHVAAVYEQR